MVDLDEFLASFDGEPGYLDWASFGPLSASVRAEAHADTEVLGSGRRAGFDILLEHMHAARGILAELLDAEEADVVLQPSTTHGLMRAIYGLSGGLLLSRAEFPSLTVTATRAANALGALTVHWMDPPDGRMTADAVREALTDDIRAVAVSLVDFRTGYRADLSALRDVIGDRLLIVDAMQGFGVVQADWAAADVICGNGYKWLRAGRGTGFSVFRERALERITPVLSGFSGVDGDLPLDVVPQPSASASAFSVSKPDHLAVARLATALADIRDLGVDVIEREITARAGDVMFFADRYGIPVRTPREPAERAGIVALAPAPQDAAPLAASLANHGLSVTVRAGLVRVSPHVATGGDTLRLFGDALAAYASTRVW